MAAITICSDFGAPKYKDPLIFSPSISHEVMGPDTMIFVFWMLSSSSAVFSMPKMRIHVKWWSVKNISPRMLRKGRSEARREEAKQGCDLKAAQKVASAWAPHLPSRTLGIMCTPEVPQPKLGGCALTQPAGGWGLLGGGWWWYTSRTSCYL